MLNFKTEISPAPYIYFKMIFFPQLKVLDIRLPLGCLSFRKQVAISVSEALKENTFAHYLSYSSFLG